MNAQQVPGGGHDQPTNLFEPGGFDTSGFTATMPGGDTTDDRPAPTERWHGGLDFGLLLSRWAVGGLVGAHGLQKFGLLGGPGIDGFAEMLTAMGFTTQTTLLAWVTAITEVGSGLLLVLGFFTPLGAAGVLGVMASVVFAKAANGFFAADGGFEFDLLIGVVAFALLFSGPGRLAVDRNTPWRREPLVFGIVALVLAAAASAAVLALCR